MLFRGTPLTRGTWPLQGLPSQAPAVPVPAMSASTAICYGVHHAGPLTKSFMSMRTQSLWSAQVHRLAALPTSIHSCTFLTTAVSQAHMLQPLWTRLAAELAWLAVNSLNLKQLVVVTA